MEPFSYAMLFDVVAGVSATAKAVAEKIRQMKELKEDAVRLARQVRAVEEVVELASYELERLERRGSNRDRCVRAHHSLQDVLTYLKNCEELVDKLCAESKLIKFFRSGDHLAHLKSASTKLAESLGPLHMVLGLHQQSELRKEFESLRAGLTNVPLEVLKGMQVQASALHEEIQRLGNNRQLSFAQRGTEIQRMVVAAAGVPSQQELQGLVQALKQEMEAMRRDKHEDEQYFKQIIDALVVSTAVSEPAGSSGGRRDYCQAFSTSGAGRAVHQSYKCPITHCVMRDPVILGTGSAASTYERSAIEQHLARCKTDPLTNKVLQSTELTPNRGLHDVIQDWLDGEGLTYEEADSWLLTTGPRMTGREGRAPGQGLPVAAAARHETVMKGAGMASTSLCSFPDPAGRLRHGAREGDVVEVRKQLTYGAGVNATDESGATALFIAAREGHKVVVDALLAAGANTEAASQDGATALFIAAQSRHVDIVKALLAAGANAEAAPKQAGATALFLAAQRGHADTVKALLTAGANAEIVPKQMEITPIFVAAEKGHTEVVLSLLAEGANMEACRKDGTRPLLAAAENGHTAVVRLLLAAGANKEVARQDGATALFLAAEKGHTEVVRSLLAEGANKDAAKKGGLTPLIIAAVNGHSGAVESLLAVGANRNAKGGGKTALVWARERGHMEIARLLQA